MKMNRPADAPVITRNPMKLAILGFFIFTLATNAQSISDGTFNNADWTLTTASSGNGGSVSATQVDTGGNPLKFRSVTDTVIAAGSSASIVHGYHISPLMSYSFQNGGAIHSLDFSFDFKTVSGAQVGVGLLIKQSGNFFLAGYAVVTGGAWQTRSVTNLQVGNFNPLGPGTLDFTAAAAPITLGFFTANSQNPFGPGYSATVHIDNLIVQPHTVPVLRIRKSQASEVELCWNSQTNTTYQVQYCSALNTNLWSALSCVQGNGGTNCIYDAPLLSQRFYRVVVTNCIPAP